MGILTDAKRLWLSLLLGACGASPEESVEGESEAGAESEAESESEGEVEDACRTTPELQHVAPMPVAGGGSVLLTASADCAVLTLDPSSGDVVATRTLDPCVGPDVKATDVDGDGLYEVAVTGGTAVGPDGILVAWILEGDDLDVRWASDPVPRPGCGGAPDCTAANELSFRLDLNGDGGLDLERAFDLGGVPHYQYVLSPDYATTLESDMQVDGLYDGIAPPHAVEVDGDDGLEVFGGGSSAVLNAEDLSVSFEGGGIPVDLDGDGLWELLGWTPGDGTYTVTITRAGETIWSEEQKTTFREVRTDVDADGDGLADLTLVHLDAPPLRFRSGLTFEPIGETDVDLLRGVRGCPRVSRAMPLGGEPAVLLGADPKFRLAALRVPDLTVAWTQELGELCWGVDIDDFDGDGAIDLAAGPFPDGTARLLSGVDLSVLWTLPVDPSGCGLPFGTLDVDGDGAADIVRPVDGGAQCEYLRGGDLEPLWTSSCWIFGRVAP